MERIGSHSYNDLLGKTRAVVINRRTSAYKAETRTKFEFVVGINKNHTTTSVVKWYRTSSRCNSLAIRTSHGKGPTAGQGHDLSGYCDQRELENMKYQEEITH